MRVVLTLAVDYDDSGYEDHAAAKQAAHDQLEKLVHHASQEGLLTGETELYVDDYKVVIK